MKTDSLTRQVYEYISHKIQEGEYTPNQRITESEICKAIGVSRTPAREALTRLAGENLLEKIHNKGFIVKEFKQKEKLDMYRIIGVLDGLAGALATNLLSDDDILRMKELTEMMDIAIKYKNYSKYLRLTNEFHDTYISKCENEMLINMINSLIYNFVPKSYINDNEDILFKALSHSNNEHKVLVEKFNKRDANEVELLLKRHWETIF